MRDYLFDTTVIIDYLRGRREVLPFIQPVLSGQATAYFSVITEAELWANIRTKQEEEGQEALLTLMKRTLVTKLIARTAGRLYEKYHSQGCSLADALIAATAKVRGKTLLTRNVKHFSLMQNEVPCEFYSL